MMKKVLLALALIIGTSSIADAGELDGKAVWCPEYNTGLVFAEGEVIEYVVKGYSINTYARYDYNLEGTSRVWWYQSGFIRNLHRETLNTTAHGQCEISSKQKIVMKLKAIIANAKNKNKI
jgi:hypothetical protein